MLVEMINRESMRILHAIIGLNVGGAELMLKRLIESHQGNHKYRHTVISLTGVGTVGQQLRADGIEVVALGMNSLWDIPRVLLHLVRFIRTSQPDVVQTWMYHADLLGGIAARFAGNRHVIWGIRTTEVTAGGSRATAFVRKLCAWLSSFVPHTVVCAAEASRRSHIAVGYDASRMIVVPNGFDLARLQATPAQRDVLRLQCGFDQDLAVIGYLGRFHPAKDQENFVRTAGMVAQKYRNVRFLMVGRDLNANNALLTKWINATGHPDRFVLLGERPDVPACLSAMDIFCLSSRTEGFPNVVAEAMAMGLPSVVTDVGDAAMLLAGNGVVVPKEDSQALALGLEQLLQMPPQTRHLIGQKAKERMHAEFSLDRAREQFEAVYQRVVESGHL